MRLKPPQQPAKAVTNHIGWISTMRKNTLAYSCLTLVLSAPMPSIADDFVELRPNDPAYVKAIKTHFQNGDLDAIVPLATQIRDWAEKMPAYFPAGSDGKPSKASPQIWLDFSAFEHATNANYQAANQLVIAGKAGDFEAAINAFKATAATCKSCHKSYRLD